MIKWQSPNGAGYTSVYCIEQPEGLCAYIMAFTPDGKPTTYDKYVETYKRGVGAIYG